MADRSRRIFAPLMAAALAATVLAAALSGCAAGPSAPGGEPGEGAGGAALESRAEAVSASLETIPASQPSPVNYRESRDWKAINQMAAYLGKSADSIIGDYDPCVGDVAYIRNEAGEYLFFSAAYATVRALFDGPVWDEGSRSQAILARRYDKSSVVQDIDHVKATYGPDMEWRGNADYCAYAFGDGMEARIYPVTGEGRDWLGIVVCPAGADNINFEMYWTVHPEKSPLYIEQPRPPDASELEKPEWEAVRRLAPYIGKSFDEIRADFPELEPYVDEEYGDEGWMRDYETGFIFAPSSSAGRDKNVCYLCEIPMGILFEDLFKEDGATSREDVMARLPVGISWYTRPGTCGLPYYEFHFGDLMIFVPSKGDGLLRDFDTVCIRKAQ